MNDDVDAIRRVLADDVESFRRLVERYQRPLLTLVRNLAPPDTDHEGVAQEVFLAAFRCLASFDPKRSAFSTWLFTIARAAAPHCGHTGGGRFIGHPPVRSIRGRVRFGRCQGR